jgi:hypothetical protein
MLVNEWGGEKAHVQLYQTGKRFLGFICHYLRKYQEHEAPAHIPVKLPHLSFLFNREAP